MTMPVRPTGPERERRFDLRVTAAFFVLLALLLVLGATVARAMASAFEQRPAWILALAGVGVAVMVRWVRRRRTLSASRLARQATETLEQAARTAVDALDAPSPAPVLVGAGGGVLTEPCPVVEPMVEATATAAATEAEPCPAEDPYEFEEEIAALCTRDGCTGAEVVGGAGDLGADVVAWTPDGRRLVIQCKRYCEGNKVGSQDLQRFGGTCFTVHEADLAVVVTTSDFTLPALEYAEQCGILCVGEDALRGWMAGTAAAPWQAHPAAG
ncbi:restriction endonuclease [Streptomyces longwoodensis]|uniref:restriction endonuclease n=1 Tax=Streptomyces longwoodensis TaxID=68231 RepID=UPI0037AB06D7